MQKKLKEYLNAPFAMRTRQIEGKQVPWFRMTSVFYGKADRNIITWVMEYQEDYLKTVFPEIASDSNGVTRKEYLGLNTAKIAKSDQLKRKIFKDIIEMNLSLNKEDSEKFMGELKVYEYEIMQEGTRIICQGPDIKFVIDELAEGKGGITAIKMSLRHNSYKRRSYKFGEKMQLVLHDNKTATWKFW